jgi:8-oxo-dGTP pyrophosphatase MutT (NUDIX family)
MRYEESFGVVPLRKNETQWQVFLIQHARGSYWGFPKGHAETGETPQEAAFRELKEETNLDFVRYLQETPLKESYQFVARGQRVVKSVWYFVAEVSGEVFLQSKEIQAGAWFSFSDAKDRLTHTEGKAILSQVIAVLC